MGKFSKTVISLPLLAGAWMVGTNTMSAAVQDLNQIQAVEILSRSEAIDAKCKYLTTSEHDELGDYAAKAEVSAAGRGGGTRASTAARDGAKAGKSAHCDTDSEITVRATIDAARRAMSAVKQANGTSKKRKKRRALKRPAGDPAVKTIKKTRVSGSAGNYTRLAAAYYVERRCQHLSHAQAVDFWQRIVKMHNTVLTRQGPDALSAAKSRAIAKAKSNRRCNTKTARMVRSSYRRIKSN